MHLTRLDLDTSRSAVGRLFGNEQRMHAMLCRAFDASRADGKILYRVVQDPRRRAVYVYSRETIDPARLPAGIFVHGQRDLSRWLENIQVGDVLSFDVIAVPSKKIGREYGSNSRRVLLRDPAERLDWMRRKASAGGFELLSCSETDERHTYTYQQAQKNQFYLTGFHFTGVLRVTDAAKFRETLAEGIGPQRAYGYGMMLVKRI